MLSVSRVALFAGAAITTSLMLGTGCPSAITPFSGTVPDAAKSLDGTYGIVITNGDQSQLPANPTLIISGGLFTKLGTTDLTPTDVQVSGSNYIWTSQTNLTVPGLSTPLLTTVTLNVNLQSDGTLTGTVVLSAQGQSSTPLNVVLTKQ